MMGIALNAHRGRFGCSPTGGMARVSPQVKAPGAGAGGGRRTLVWLLAAVMAASALFTGCGGGLNAGRRKGPPLFYPPLPNRPRLQFLAAYTNARDIEKSSSMEEFLVGADDMTVGLIKPYGVTLHDDKIFVADPGAKRIWVLDLEKQEFRPLKGGEGGGRPKQPIQVVTGPDGWIYISDGGRSQVLIYDSNERFIRALGTEGDIKPAGLAVRGDEVYVCDLKNHHVVVYHRKTGEVLRRLGGEGRGPGKTYYPTNIAVGPNGDLYVSETGNFRIQQLKPDGTSVRIYGSVGDRPGNFARPRGVAVDNDGNMYAVDAAFENVQIFDPEGRLLLFFGGPGNDEGNMVLPAGIEITTRGLKRYQALADPKFKLKYIVTVVSQYGPRRVSIYGFGDWTGALPKLKTPPPTTVGGAAAPPNAGAPSAPDDGPRAP